MSTHHLRLDNEAELEPSPWHGGWLAAFLVIGGVLTVLLGGLGLYHAGAAGQLRVDQCVFTTSAAQSWFHPMSEQAIQSLCASQR